MEDVRPRQGGRWRRVLPLIALALLIGAYVAYRIIINRRPYQWSGTVEARTILVGSRVGGRVKQVLVQEGDSVSAQQPIVLLEPGALSARLTEAEGQLEAAIAELELARQGPRVEEIAQTQSRLAAAQAVAAKAARDARRAQRLFRQSAIPKTELDDAQSRLKDTEALRNAVAAELEQLERGYLPEEIRAKEAAVTSAQGRLQSVRSDLDELTIKAPRAAVVEALSLRPGDIVVSQAPVATLLERDQLFVRIYIPETRLGRVHLGDVVPISVDSFPRKSFRGIVEHISQVGEYTPRNLQTPDERADQVFATRIGLLDGRGDLRAGMAAWIEVPK